MSTTKILTHNEVEIIFGDGIKCNSKKIAVPPPHHSHLGEIYKTYREIVEKLGEPKIYDGNNLQWKVIFLDEYGEWHPRGATVYGEYAGKDPDEIIRWYIGGYYQETFDAAKEVLNRKEKVELADTILWTSLKNYCPGEVLAEVLRRGENNMISCRAAGHKNCPPEALVEVLKRGKNDLVSKWAFDNKNCPSKARSEWIKAIMQLT